MGASLVRLCRIAAVASIVAMMAGTAAAAPPPVHGALTFSGCLRDTNATLLTGCLTSTDGLNEPSDIVVDGNRVYVAASGGGAFPNGSDVVTLAAQADGSLTSLGCIMQPGSNAGCASMAHGLNTPVALALTGSNVYVASQNSQAVATLNRAADGTLSANSCVKDAASTETCDGTGHGLGLTSDVALSPDGASVYASSIGDSAVATLTPGAGGALAFTGCIKLDTSAATCDADGQGLLSARAVAVFGSNVYVADPNPPGNAVAVLNRGAGGALTFGSCVKDPSSTQTCATEATGLADANDVAVSPDGNNVYVSAGRTLVVFNRSQADGSLTPAGCFEAPGSGLGCGKEAPGLSISGHLVVSTDGRNVYSTSGDITTFTRDPATGALTPAGCLGQTDAGGCTQTTGLYTVTKLALSADGTRAYAADVLGDVAWFSRQVAPTCTGQTLQVPYGTSPQITLACSDANGDPLTLAATAPAHGALSAIDQPAAKVTYTAAPGYSGADSFTFTASDGELQSEPQTIVLTDAPLADPVLQAFSVSPRRFAVGPGRTAITAAKKRRAPRGTKFGYTLSQAASVKLRLVRRAAGRRVGKRCLAPTKARRHRKRCTRSIGAGTLTRAAAAGKNTTRFSGRVGTHRLKPGTYRWAWTLRDLPRP